MSEPSPTPENTQETFISHLIELRSRLLRSNVAIVVVLVCLFPWAKDIYAVLAAPLLKALPHGSTMIATDVTGTFLVPLKVTLMAAFLIAMPTCSIRCGRSSRRACTTTKSGSRCR